MLDIIEAKNISALMFFISIRVVIILVCWLFMVISCIVDFWSGTTTAKTLGEKLMSHGFRRTITKIGDYVRLMLFALMFDILGSLLPLYTAPFATILCTIAVIFIESKSVVENSRRKKAQAGNVPDIIKKIIQTTTTKQGHEVFNEISKILTLKSKDNEKD